MAADSPARPPEDCDLPMCIKPRRKVPVVMMTVFPRYWTPNWVSTPVTFWSLIMIKDQKVTGVETQFGVQYLGKTVIITTGTFLRGLMHIGKSQSSGGRAGESAAMGLSDSLKEIGLKLGRLKTGTPPRILKKSIDFTMVKSMDFLRIRGGVPVFSLPNLSPISFKESDRPMAADSPARPPEDCDLPMCIKPRRKVPVVMMTVFPRYWTPNWVSTPVTFWSLIMIKDQKVTGVETQFGVQYLGKTVIITTGTFLRGLMHIGKSQSSGGRAGESAAMGLSDSLKEIGLKLGRLKTGTPPRILKKSIDFTKTETQAGDEPVPYFSYWKDDLFHVEHSGIQSSDIGHSEGKYPPGSILDKMGGQLNCQITQTTKKTGEIIRKNLHMSPMYSGIIEGTGPRYCPSIEDKIVRFEDKETHQVFLEPEGIATDEYYINGFSTSLPFEVQVDLIQSIQGLESAEILRPAYAVEYDFVDPTQLYASLETKSCDGLFLAGQINGTSGYEEAGAQGLVAGINAARKVQSQEPIVLKRSEAYIGVLIDDLITKGTSEPYRMFTSRAEYRLLLRQDNADQRLSRLGHDLGLLPERNFKRFKEKEDLIQNEVKRLRSTRKEGVLYSQILKRPEIGYLDIPGYPNNRFQAV